MRSSARGNWDTQYYETVDPTDLFSGTYGFVYLEGGDGVADAMNAFITANHSAMEQFVASGHTLLVNAAPWWSSSTTMNLGFGGVTATENYADSVSAVDPAAAIFQGPFTPVATAYTGDSFGHAAISGPGLTPLLVDGGGNAVIGRRAVGIRVGYVWRHDAGGLPPAAAAGDEFPPKRDR